MVPEKTLTASTLSEDALKTRPETSIKAGFEVRTLPVQLEDDAGKIGQTQARKCPPTSTYLLAPTVGGACNQFKS